MCRKPIFALLSRRARRHLPEREGEDASRPGGGDDAQLRALNGAAPCGRKEGRDDGSRARRGRGHHRRRQRWCHGVAAPEGQTEKRIRILSQTCLLKPSREGVKKDLSGGRIAQLVRALASHARGRRFKSCCDHHKLILFARRRPECPL